MILDRLRPEPHRGPVIAAGAVPLALAALLIELRMRQWALGPKFAVVALTAGLLLTMGWLAELEGDAPRAYRSVLLVGGLLVLFAALTQLAEILGARRPPGSGGLFWIFAVQAGVAAGAARRANSGACTLIAALAGVAAVEAFVAWVFAPQGIGTFRAMLLVIALAFIAGAIRLRDRRRRHAVALVNAAGLATLALGLSFALSALIIAALNLSGSTLVAFGGEAATAFGWKLYLLAAGLGLLAYAAADHEPGPAYVGLAVLAVFVFLAGVTFTGRGSLVGWPLFLLIIAGVGLVIGLRPSTPLPPEPPGPAPPSTPTVPLRPVDDEQ